MKKVPNSDSWISETELSDLHTMIEIMLKSYFQFNRKLFPVNFQHILIRNYNYNHYM